MKLWRLDGIVEKEGKCQERDNVREHLSPSWLEIRIVQLCCWCFTMLFWVISYDGEKGAIVAQSVVVDFMTSSDSSSVFS